MLASDIVFYQSANMPENDASLSGGAINLAGKVEFTDLATNDVVRVVSDDAGDNAQSVTVAGRLASGAIDSDVIALNGITPVAGAITFERVLSITLSAAATGNVTIERNTGANDDVVIMAPGDTSIRRLFYDSASEAGAVTRYEKIFARNVHGVDTLNSAAMQLTADPAAVIRIGYAPAKDDTVTVFNRKVVPAGVTFVDDGISQNIPTGLLAASEAIGIWVEMALGAGAAAIKNTFSVEQSGTSV